MLGICLHWLWNRRDESFLASTQIPYSVWSNNDVTLSILLHKVEYYPLYLDPFYFIISVVVSDVPNGHLQSIELNKVISVSGAAEMYAMRLGFVRLLQFAIMFSIPSVELSWKLQSCPCRLQKWLGRRTTMSLCNEKIGCVRYVFLKTVEML